MFLEFDNPMLSCKWHIGRILKNLARGVTASCATVLHSWVFI